MSVLPHRKSINLTKLITNKFFPYLKSNQNDSTKTQPSFGRWQDQLDLIRSTWIDFYEDLFTTCNPNSQPESLSYIPQLVSYEINSQLSSNFMAWEIHTAFKQMAPMKALGPDGSLKQP